MKKVEPETETDELRPEYDLSQLKGRVRGKYAERYQEGTNLVLLAPDVAEAFPDADSVNEALRFLIRVTKENGLAPPATKGDPKPGNVTQCDPPPTPPSPRRFSSPRWSAAGASTGIIWAWRAGAGTHTSTGSFRKAGEA